MDGFCAHERCRPPREILPIPVEKSVYNLEKAKTALEAMLAISAADLHAKLTTPGQVCDLPYPGIGLPPRRPGGDLKFAGRAQLAYLPLRFADYYEAGGRGHLLHVSGPKGIGKSCYLRAFAWFLILQAHENKEPKAHSRIVCLWSMAAAYDNLLLELLAALRFTYCLAEDVLQDIDSIKSMEDVDKFLERREALGDMFYFIVDGAEVLDAHSSQGSPRPDKERRIAVSQQLSGLLQKAHVSVKALSPMADCSLKRKADSYWIYFQEGFWAEEYDAYVNKASFLGDLPWQQEIKYYAGRHPLSLSLLDFYCRLHAKSRTKVGQELNRAFRIFKRTDHEIAQLLKDKEEWEEAVKLFVSSAEITSIRILLSETLSSLSSACHSQASMMARDMRFVVGDPETEVAEYVTPYISRIYIEGFREAESKKVYEKAAWQHYCTYLLHQGGPINWAEMGWLVENLAAEIISFRGLKLDGMSICSNRTQRFGCVPEYSSWIAEVEAGAAIYFLPCKYNYRSIDGLLVWKDVAGKLHLLAIQVTVNPEEHQDSSSTFMSHNTIINWIPADQLSKWQLHFVFLCLKSLEKKHVASNVKPMKTGGAYGTVEHTLHTVSFQDAFAGSVDTTILQTLKDVAGKRYDASDAAAKKEAQAELKAIADAVGPAPERVVQAIQSILSRSRVHEEVAGKYCPTSQD